MTLFGVVVTFVGMGTTIDDAVAVVMVVLIVVNDAVLMVVSVVKLEITRGIVDSVVITPSHENATVGHGSSP